MCGRISQYRDPLRYAQHLGLSDPLMLFDAADRRPGYNLSPGTHPLAIYPDQTLRAIHWGYCPDWARVQHLPQTINARAETAAHARYFKALWKTGRVLVPADGWFEWRVEAAPDTDTGDDAVQSAVQSALQSTTRSTTQGTRQGAGTIRQPYFVRLKSDAPMYFAALSSVRGTAPQTEGMGLVIVTATADAGLIDVHDRRPLVFAPDAARRWLDPALPPDELQQLARGACVPAGRFRWHRVSPEVDRTLNDEPRLIEALD
ncbi:SOS response-associated peptidase [Paraburkholderia lacunae]|uniref:Abasic site processing protein n=1 Tax=Paraburkholderia lacunae TaxID=2211104 RepID=A0A370N474_9BURK|nr:SOS response-associated peptidase [Paraburkholderia lacunae]